MQEGARRLRQRGNLRYRLHNPGLVIGQHDGDQRPLPAIAGERRERSCERRKIEPAVGADRHHLDGVARKAAARQHGGMLDG